MLGVKEILKRVKRLEITTNKLVGGVISGNYRSVFRGQGMEFSEVREYLPGDDVRNIDWNVTARFNSPFIKEFIEERDLDIYIIFDVSGSSEFGYKRSKKEVGVEVAASVMFAALRNNDNVSLVLFTDRVERYVPPRKGKRHVLRLLRELIYFEPTNKKTDIDEVLTYLNRIIKRRGVIFIISDFMANTFDGALKRLKNRHDVILINLSDIREGDIPNVGYLLLEDRETGKQTIVNTGSKKFREAYADQGRKRQRDLSEKMKRLKVDMIELNTDEPPHHSLKRFFDLRVRRR